MNKSLISRRRNFVFRESTKFAPVKRNEIHGADSYLRVFDSLIYQLKNFKLLNGDGVKIPSGVCLYGPPGTGKTFFSRYLATESGACFVDMRKFPRPVIDYRTDPLAPDDIIDLFRLSKLFVKKFSRPVVLFYDELTGDTDDDILEQLRMEIDGIAGKSNGILLVVTAFDEPEEIDESLFRDQRISLHLPFTAPTPKGREAIFRYYLGKVPHEENIDVSGINALFDEDTTPATIAGYVDEAYAKASESARLAKKGKNKLILTEKYLLDSIVPHLAGFFAEDSLTEDDKHIVEFHEAGHAYLGAVLGLSVQVVSAYRSISSDMLSHGLTISIMPDDKLTTIKELKDRLILCFGGMVAEKLCGFAENTGTRGDIESINKISQMLVNRLSQGSKLRSKYGVIVLDEKSSYSGEVLRLRDQDIASLIKNAEKQATKLAKNGFDKIKKIAQRLHDKKIIFQRELNELIK